MWWASNLYKRLIGVGSFLPSLVWNFILTFITKRKWYDRIDKSVILGALPFSIYAAKLMYEENVGAVVSLNEDYELWWANGKKEWEGKGIEFLQLPIKDIFDTPSQNLLRTGVDFIINFTSNCDYKHKAQEKTVYIHCKAGRTRSATLVACYLMKRYGWNPEKAVEYMRSKRPHVWLCQNHWESLKEFHKQSSLK